MTVRVDGTTVLTEKLDKGGTHYACRGQRPWLADDKGAGCAEHLRGTLLSASNLYFANVESAIFLPPPASVSVPLALADFLASPSRASAIATLRDWDALNVAAVRKRWQQELAPFADEQVESALTSSESPEMPTTDAVHDAAAFRREEYQVLGVPQAREQLRVKIVPASEYKEPIGGQPFSTYFSDVSLVERLRETRALYGFSRVKPENKVSLQQQKAQLRLKPLPPADDWLPAYTTFGEGIFLKFNESLLTTWERDGGPAKERSDLLGAAYAELASRGWGAQSQLSPRFLLIHTLSHLLINRLTFECGYSSASLKERLYVSSDEKEGMAGVLIYTAAGDADGTMGGLVRMGKPGRLEAVIRRAIEGAGWCSADPVCMEMGIAGGQGPDSCNLAACHTCALVPETACEQFNRFLDRGVVVGGPMMQDVGYFR
ncbi:DUF1998 domain-containing protein [Corallococcus exiguus]|nr:DUF1998 domain-containing protein [Corallococcus exiguus]